MSVSGCRSFEKHFNQRHLLENCNFNANICFFGLYEHVFKMISAIFLGFLLFTSLSAAPNRQYAESNGKISVMLSERNPFVFFNENGTPVGLDISIIENFAQKFHLRIDYIVINSSLNEIFSNEKNFNASSILNDIKYVDVSKLIYVEQKAKCSFITNHYAGKPM